MHASIDAGGDACIGWVNAFGATGRQRSTHARANAFTGRSGCAGHRNGHARFEVSTFEIDG
jgi:hypothetical protein